jgi:Fibronectin type III domain
VFLIYVLFLIVSGIAMFVMASVKSGQTAGRRAWYAVFGAGFTLYGLYLLLFFPGGHYLLFFYAFILPVLMTVRFFRDRSAFRAKQQAAALQGPLPSNAQPPGYAQPPGGGDNQELSAAAAAAAPQGPLIAPGLVTGNDPATGRASATAAPRRRRRWVVLVLAAVMVLGLAAGLVVWAPWTPPPVLRPAGLVAGPSTASSVAFHWWRPRTGPLPDKYLILGIGTPAGTVAGTVTSYRQTGLTPATTYQYRVVAVRGEKRSPQSAVLTVRTLTPPISQARLQGSWRVHAKTVGPAPPGRRNGYMTWQLRPACAADACDVVLHGKNGSFSFRVKLTRRGLAYAGQAITHFGCGSRANSIPYPVTLGPGGR